MAHKGGALDGGNRLLDRSKVKILLCDNDANSSQEVLRLLCKCSYQVTSVRTARQVIDTLNAQGPDIDIILAEVDLPIAKGFKMLKYIMRDMDLKRIPIIMMSSQDEVSVVVKCLRLGAADYLVKPLRTNELLNLWTHVWRRRRMLGLAEKDILNHGFDFVGSDPSDANTNSTTLFSDDTDDKSRRSTVPETSVSNRLEVTEKHKRRIYMKSWRTLSNTSALIDSSLKNLSEYQPDVLEPSDQAGGISPFRKKSELKVGMSSAFFTYVKASAPTNNSHSFVRVDETVALSEHLSNEENLPSLCKQASDVERLRFNIRGSWEAYSRGSEFANVENGPCMSTDERSFTVPVPVPVESPQGWTSTKEQLSTGHLHSGNKNQVDTLGVPSHTPLPFYWSGSTTQIMMPASAQQYQGSLHDVPMHATSALLPQYNALSQCPHIPMMTSFSYYPVNISMQPRQMSTPHVWPLMASSSFPEVKSGRIERREAALIKFKKKRKDRCFDKKIRYVNRKRLAEKRPRVRGQFVRQINGVDVDLNGRPTAVDDSDEDIDEDDEEEPVLRELGVDSSPEHDSSAY
eukprot:TRINITY_DN1316_c0_g1_i1.p1 TRINITY_DN1316_c0_g1~~TRINITY_DN1316_c0_g1_i1.p1  ORF type:complete len:573 (-),score=92.82 TRINITY_DN1316_c0_g1_i1:189-1907(-)